MKVTMTSSAVTLYGQCWWRHLVGRRAVSDVSVIRSFWSICTCSLCSEFNNANLLLRMLTAVLGTSVLLHILNTGWPTTWRHVLGDQWHHSALSIEEVAVTLETIAQHIMAERQRDTCSGTVILWLGVYRTILWCAFWATLCRTYG